jgi:hypothetical protein
MKIIETLDEKRERKEFELLANEGPLAKVGWPCTFERNPDGTYVSSVTGFMARLVARLL